MLEQRDTLLVISERGHRIQLFFDIDSMNGSILQQLSKFSAATRLFSHVALGRSSWGRSGRRLFGNGNKQPIQK